MKMYANMCELLHCCEAEHDIKTAQKGDIRRRRRLSQAENMIACWHSDRALLFLLSQALPSILKFIEYFSLSLSLSRSFFMHMTEGVNAAYVEE